MPGTAGGEGVGLLGSSGLPQTPLLSPPGNTFHPKRCSTPDNDLQAPGWVPKLPPSSSFQATPPGAPTCQWGVRRPSSSAGWSSGRRAWERGSRGRRGGGGGGQRPWAGTRQEPGLREAGWGGSLGLTAALCVPRLQPAPRRPSTAKGHSACRRPVAGRPCGPALRAARGGTAGPPPPGRGSWRATGRAGPRADRPLQLRGCRSRESAREAQVELGPQGGVLGRVREGQGLWSALAPLGRPFPPCLRELPCLPFGEVATRSSRSRPSLGSGPTLGLSGASALRFGSPPAHAVTLALGPGRPPCLSALPVL